MKRKEIKAMENEKQNQTVAALIAIMIIITPVCISIGKPIIYMLICAHAHSTLSIKRERERRREHVHLAA